MILLAPKPHQEGINNIKDFVWRLCVSYRGLNSVTKPFIFPIPRCAESIEDFGDSNGPMFFITLDTQQAYHQILVRLQDREKLAFFTPDCKKKAFRVVPFGPKNAPVFYTAMMKTFQEEWNADFDSTIVDPPNPQDLLDNTSDSRTSPIRTVFVSRIVIDNIFLYGTNVYQLLRYFASVATIFVKYGLSFKLAK